MNPKELICIESDALEVLVDRLVSYVKEAHDLKRDEWIPEAEAMKILNISSKTTLSTWRAEGKILYSQPAKKILLYSRSSLEKFIERHSKHTF